MNVLNAQSILQLYNTSFGSFAHILIIPDDTIKSVIYNVKCGGAQKPESRMISGYHFPLKLSVQEYPNKADDHKYGCSRLRYEDNPDLVNAFVERLTLALNKIYIDSSSLKLEVDKSRIVELMEGIVPVIVTGISFCGAKFSEPTKAYLITGNCI